MRISARPRTVEITGIPVQFARTAGGVMEIRAPDDCGVAAGIGFAHAHDRLVQMSIMRLIGQGRLSECTRVGDAQLQADTFSRLMGFAYYAKQEVARCSPASLTLASAYSDGVNHYLRHYRLPFEFRLMRYHPEPWAVEDTLLIIKLTIYLLSHSQRQMENFLIQAVSGGTSVSKLQQLFAPHLDGLSDELVGYIRRVNLWKTPGLNASLTAGLAARNNWAVAGKHSVTGYPLECHDPHLPCNFLPQPWYELVTHVGDRYSIGISIPGIPGLVMGRNNDVSVGFTHGFMDMIDYFLEECRGGEFWQDRRWCDLSIRTETIHRRGQSPMEIVVRETPRGVIETDPRSTRLDDGLHLCCAWSALEQGAAESLDVMSRAMTCRSVLDVQQAIRHAAISANWVIADRQGNIGYQQSGLLPVRHHSGLYPLPGWDSNAAWGGFVDVGQLATSINPASGFLATANDDLQDITDRPTGINLCMGRDRVDRIQEILRRKAKLSLPDMEEIQMDLRSRQAERLMHLLRPLLPIDVPSAKILRHWDLRYDAGSRGATLFEAVYSELLNEVFGRRMFGEATWKALVNDTPLLASYFHYFDACLLEERNHCDEEEWFGPAGRDDLFREVLQRVLATFSHDRITPLGVQQRFVFRNLISSTSAFRLPGIDRGPMVLEGARASIHQCNVVRALGLQAAVAPSYRSITDLGTDTVQTSLAGGPSGRIWSPLYFSECKRWRKHEYKQLSS